MAQTTLAIAHLDRELEDFLDRFPHLGKDDLFVLWFLRAFLTDNEEEAAQALTGGTGDKNVDAVLIDDNSKSIFIIQSKYRQTLMTKAEGRNDVMTFAGVAESLSADLKHFREFTEDLDPQTAKSLERARERFHRRKYRLQLYYVTLGKFTRSVRDETTRYVRRIKGPSDITINFLDGNQILRLFADYLDGVAPPVALLELNMEGPGTPLQRYDRKTRIESWIFSMAGPSVAELLKLAGVRLFARNIRGFLGRTAVNRGMEETLLNEPEFFWYYNNGITIICDHAKRTSQRGRDVLRVTNPQVINGQQTTRTLYDNASNGHGASVLVRVISVPRDPRSNDDGFEALVSSVVAATNWQNAIRASDLMSNDRRQVELQRQLRKLRYEYIRKRQTKREARRSAGTRARRLIKKEELAKAVAACDLDPITVRLGKEKLFEEDLYPHVFPTGDPYYYLTRYWLMRMVGTEARGKPERAYAKWVVLNFVWSKLSPFVETQEDAARFVSTCEHTNSTSYALRRAIGATFVGALRFFRANRGRGASAIDVSTFFKRRGLDTKFSNYWRPSRETSRQRFERRMKEFTVKFRGDQVRKHR